MKLITDFFSSFRSKIYFTKSVTNIFLPECGLKSMNSLALSRSKSLSVSLFYYFLISCTLSFVCALPLSLSLSQEENSNEIIMCIGREEVYGITRENAYVGRRYLDVISLALMTNASKKLKVRGPYLHFLPIMSDA
jgi:hypothetical protein